MVGYALWALKNLPQPVLDAQESAFPGFSEPWFTISFQNRWCLLHDFDIYLPT